MVAAGLGSRDQRSEFSGSSPGGGVSSSRPARARRSPRSSPIRTPPRRPPRPPVRPFRPGSRSPPRPRRRWSRSSRCGSPARTPASRSAPGRYSAMAISFGCYHDREDCPVQPIESWRHQRRSPPKPRSFWRSKGSDACRTGASGQRSPSSYPSVPMPKRFFFYFTQVDGRLLIDGILGEISFSVP